MRETFSDWGGPDAIRRYEARGHRQAMLTGFWRLFLSGLVFFLSSDYGRVVAQSIRFQASEASWLHPVESGRTYQALWSADLSDWQKIGDVFLPSESVPWRFPDGKQGFARLIPEFKIDETILRIVIIGDSTIADWSHSKSRYHGWGEALGSLLSNVVIFNQAAAWISASKFIEDQRIKRVQLASPHVVIMQFGHIENSRTNNVPDNDYERNLSLIISDIRNLGAKPILVTPVAKRFFDADGNLNRDWPHSLENRRASMMRVAQEERVALVDLNRTSSELFERYGKEETHFIMSCGSLDFSECPDLHHFSLVGSFVMAALAAENFPPLLQAYSVPLESITSLVVNAFEHDRQFTGFETPFVESTEFEEDEIWSWVFPDRFPLN